MTAMHCLVDGLKSVRLGVRNNFFVYSLKNSFVFLKLGWKVKIIFFKLIN